MGYDLKITAKAHIDIINAIDYCDNINPELGTRFQIALSDAFEQLIQNPQFYSFVSFNPRDKFRDMKLDSFPYLVVFEIYEPAVIVTSVMSTYQKPLF